MNPLEALVRTRIETAGPMPLSDFMALALGHLEYGYYMARDSVGARGDFTTAPEISQMYGEIVGAWLAETWERAGRPRPVRLVELGPGRGTLMADILRTFTLVPALRRVVEVHLVETSARLRLEQQDRLAESASRPVWHETFAQVPRGPMLLVANEFFDALPIRQFVCREAIWCERCVDIGPDGRLVFVAGPPADLDDIPLPLRDAAEGAIVERAPIAEAIAGEIGTRLATHPGVALIVDYGYCGPATGDTLQALRARRFADPLEAPGEADLTTHVDFSALAAAARRRGARAFSPVSQASFLTSLGIGLRAERLRSSGASAADLSLAIERLTGAGAMGTLFRMLALASPDIAVPEPFAAPPACARTRKRRLMIRAPSLVGDAVRHAFFTRRGGVSTGIYDSLNIGLGSRDSRDNVMENRARVARSLGVDPDRLMLAYQYHSDVAVCVEAPWPADSRPKADALVTATPGLAVAVSTADCGPVLFADADASVVGAAHAGWRGAFGGILEATLAAMESLGASRSRIVAVLGPTISAANYEVGPEFRETFLSADAGNARFFADGPSGRPRFDLPAYIIDRLQAAGVAHAGNLARCTYGEDDEFFSYRRSTHRGEPDFGRLVAGIAIAE